MYARACCGTHSHNLASPLPEDSNYSAWNKSLQQVLDGLNNKKLKPQDLNVDLFRYYRDTMVKGAGKGFKLDFSKVDYDTPDYALLTKMKNNLYGFSGAKTYAHLRELNSYLYDSNGKIADAKDFKDKASAFYKSVSVTEEKYQRWLDVEYDTAIAQGTMARQWVGWMDNIDLFPNLRYRTAGDGRVRPEHAKLDGVVVAKGSAYCDQIIPIKDFGCRCDMEETKDDATENPPSFTHDEVFQGNVGKDGNVISKKHPYYPQSKAMREAVQNRVDEFAKADYIDNQKSIYDQYKGDKNYTMESFDDESGGFLVRHKKSDNYKPEEKKAIDTLVKKGEGVVLPEKIKIPYTPSHDLFLNQVPFEIKCIWGNIQEKTKQRVRDAMSQAGNVVLSFQKKIDLKALKDGLEKVTTNDRLNTILILEEEKMAVITKKEILAGDYSALDIFK